MNYCLIEPEAGKRRHDDQHKAAIKAALRNAVSPEIGPTLELLGKDTVLNRIDRCLAANDGSAAQHV